MARILSCVIVGLAVQVVLPCAEAERVTTHVDLQAPNAAAQWVLPAHSGASIKNGELILDGVKHRAPEAFLTRPVLGDLTLRCKIRVEADGGVRAFAINFHSTGIASYQWLHVNRSAAILGWSDREQHWHELTRVPVKRKEGTWLDVRLECEGPNIRYYQDGKLVASIGDSHYKAGRIGFAASQGLIRIKDIRLEGTPAQLEKAWRADPVRRQPVVGTYHELDPKRRHTKASGKLDIEVSKPFIISSRISRPEMGTHEQPHLFKMPCGDIHLVFHKEGDIHGATRVILRSSDRGKSWEPLPITINRHEAVGVRRDGTVLVYDDYAFRKEGDAFVGQMCISKDGGRTFGPVQLATFQRHPNTSPARAATSWAAKDLEKYRSTSAKWSDELCHALWRSVLEKPDGKMIACAHTRYKEDKEGRLRVVCYHSEDGGRTWGSESTVAHDPDIGGEGFVEPVMSFCSNGDVLCMIRHGLWQARSTDGGRTWQPYTTLDVRGVDPDLCLMSGGVLACSYGRPGNRIMFSADGTAKEWTDHLQIYEYQSGSFGYTGIVEVAPGKLLYVYDRNDRFAEYDGRRTTAIQGVYITVKKRNVDPIPEPGSKSSAQVNSSAEVDVIAEWHFAPIYTLDGYAKNAPGLQDLLKPTPPAPLTPPVKRGPLLFGEEPESARIDLVEPQDLPTGQFSVEAWILDHVNRGRRQEPKPVGFLTGVVDPDDRTGKGWVFAYYHNKFLLGAPSYGDGAESDPPKLLLARAPGKWKTWFYHAVATFDSENLRVYVNGELVAEAPAPKLEYPEGHGLTTWSYFASEPAMQLGNLLLYQRLFDQALSADQVQARFDGFREQVGAGHRFANRRHFTAGPVLQYPTKDSVTILWETDEPCTAKLRYGTQQPGSEVIEVAKASELHEVHLKNLKADTPYFYDVSVKFEDGTILESGSLSFQTAVRDDQPYSFVAIADTEQRPHVNDLICKAAWGERPHFVLNLGDLTDGGQSGNRYEWTHEYFPGMEQLSSRVAIFPVVGNGESDLRWYKHYHALPAPEYYYTFTYGNAQFFMLDSNRSLGPNSEQYVWLEKQLAKCKAKWKFSGYHHNPYTSDHNHKYGDDNARLLVPLFEKYGVDIVFYGHIHGYERTWPLREGKADPNDGVIYVQCGGAGGNLGHAALTRVSIVKKVDRSYHYCNIDVFGDVLEYKMIDTEGRVRDRFTLKK